MGVQFNEQTLALCVCVCVCEREREREREGLFPEILESQTLRQSKCLEDIQSMILSSGCILQSPGELLRLHLSQTN